MRVETAIRLFERCERLLADHSMSTPSFDRSEFTALCDLIRRRQGNAPWWRAVERYAHHALSLSRSARHDADHVNAIGTALYLMAADEVRLVPQPDLGSGPVAVTLQVREVLRALKLAPDDRGPWDVAAPALLACWRQVFDDLRAFGRRDDTLVRLLGDAVAGFATGTTPNTEALEAGLRSWLDRWGGDHANLNVPAKGHAILLGTVLSVLVHPPPISPRSPAQALSHADLLELVVDDGPDAGRLQRYQHAMTRSTGNFR